MSPDSSAFPSLRLRHGEDRRLRAGHLWIFSNEVDIAATPLTALRPGQLVRVLADRGAALGTAYVNPAALICARLLTRHPDTPIDAALLERRLRSALALRERLYPSPYYRWCFGESDGLPGLVLDRFGDIVVGQIATAGMETLREAIEQAIRSVLAPVALVWKNDTGARDLERLPHEVRAAWGEVPAEVDVQEQPASGVVLRYRAPLAEGQKTGWFYDQAGNRSRLLRYLARGARVLDVCSYVGSWGLTAAVGGAAEVTCVDSSQRAIDYARRNAQANGLAIETLHGDAFEALAALVDAQRRFDVVVLDPPAFIKRRREAGAGRAAYRRLNALALRLLDTEGLLVSCSCSYHLEADALQAAIQSAARHVGRFVQLLETGGQAPDHPIHPAIPETRYLKAFFCRVTAE